MNTTYGNTSAGRRFRDALDAERPLQIVGTINAYTALMAERAGYRAIYLSGAGVANASYGLPDLGMTTLDNVLEDASRITAACDVPLLVDIDTGQRRNFRPCGDQDIVSGIGFGAAIAGHLDLAGLCDLRGTGNPGHLVLIEQETDALGQVFDHLVLACHQRFQIELHLADLDAVLRQMALRFLELFGRMQKCLGRNTADVQARAAPGAAFVDTGCLEAELCGADRGDVATRARPDDDQVEMGIAHFFTFSGLRHRISGSVRQQAGCARDPRCIP